MWDVGVGLAASGRVMTYSNNKLWFSPREGMSEWKLLSLFCSPEVQRICFAFPRRRSSLVHCWNSVGNEHTPPPCFLAHSWSHTHMPLCWHVLQRRSVFIRSRPSLHYLELLMQRAMWTWNWKQMFHIDYRLLGTRFYACLIQKNNFLDVTFRLWVNCVSQKPKDFLSCSFHRHRFHHMLWSVLCCAACFGWNPRHETWLTL